MLPNFLIIGAARAGTTSLYAYLEQHPDVYMSPLKETRFFAVEELQIDKRDPIQSRIWADSVTTWDDYVRLFDGVMTEHAVGEASPIYLAWSRKCAAAIHRRLPDVKLIACLRQPVERAFSHYLHNLELEIDDAPTFEDALDHDARTRRTDYLEQGYYARHLAAYFELFPREHIKVYLFCRDLAERTDETFADICRFLDVDPAFPARTEKRHNTAAPGIRVPVLTPLAKAVAAVPVVRRLAGRVLPGAIREQAVRLVRPSSRQTALDRQTRRRLTQLFKDDILQLQQMLERDLSHWLSD